MLVLGVSTDLPSLNTALGELTETSNLDAQGPPRIKAISYWKSTDWWGDLHFRAFSIQCTPRGWHVTKVNDQ